VGSPRDAADLPGSSQSSVVITSQGAPVVAVVNRHQGPGAGNEALSCSGISQGATSVSLPLVSNMVGGWLTSVIAQNASAPTTTVTAPFVSLDGTRTASLTRTVAPGRPAVIDPRFESSLVAGTEYTVALTAPSAIAVVANNHNDLPGTVAPMGDSHNGVAAALGSAYLPYIAKNTDGVGQETTLSVTFRNSGATTWTKGSAHQARLGVNGDDRTFSFRVRRVRAGTFSLHLRPVIDGIAWMEGEGVYMIVAVR